MNTLTIPLNEIPFRGSYQIHVITHGHIPGVLSGAELTGKAREWSSKYQRSRNKVVNYIESTYDVKSSLFYSKKRKTTCRIWTDENTKRPIKLILE